jgi:hypothetical protein
MSDTVIESWKNALHKTINSSSFYTLCMRHLISGPIAKDGKSQADFIIPLN